jgi:hypothetical protein
MKGNILFGLGRHMVPVPAVIWTRLIDWNAQQTAGSLDFMTDKHHRVRDFIVREMPDSPGPLAPETIAAALDLTREQVIELLDQLETRLIFLYRGDGINVSWAYPMTVDPSPHRVTLDDGVQVQAS